MKRAILVKHYKCHECEQYRGGIECFCPRMGKLVSGSGSACIWGRARERGRR